MRIILVLLLLAVFFLAGTLYGAGFEKANSGAPLVEESALEMDSTVIESVDEQREVVPAHTGNTPAYQAASALESIVNFFYDAIVDVLYQISKVFF